MNVLLPFNKLDVSRGSGIRVTLTVSSDGVKFTENIKTDLFAALSNPYVAGLSVIGNDPFDTVNAEVLYGLFVEFRCLFHHKDIWVWSSHLVEEWLADGNPKNWDYKNHLSQLAMLENMDYLVDGPFIEGQKKKLAFRSSVNQRILKIERKEAPMDAGTRWLLIPHDVSKQFDEC